MKTVIRKVTSSAVFWTWSATMGRMGSGLVVLVIANPLLSQAEMGLAYLFTTLTFFVNLFDAGFSQTQVRMASVAMAGATKFTGMGMDGVQATGTPNYPLLQCLAGSLDRTYRYIWFGAMALLFLPGSWLIWARIREAGLPLSNLGAWFLFAGASALGLRGLCWTSLLVGAGGLRLANQSTALCYLPSIAITASALLGGLGLWAFGLGALCLAVTLPVIIRRQFFRMTGLNRRETRRSGRSDLIRTMWPMSWRQGVNVLAGFLSNRMGIVLSGTFLSLADAASLGMTIQILTLLGTLAMVPVSVVLPGVPALRLLHHGQAVVQLYGPRLYCGLGLFLVSAPAALLLSPFVLGWLGGATKLLPLSAGLLLALHIALDAHQSVHSSIVLAENVNPFPVRYILAGAAGVVISMLLLTSGLGLMALILGPLVSQLAVNQWWTVRRAIRGLGMTPGEYFRCIVRAPVRPR